jgi:hypothetical protein
MVERRERIVVAGAGSIGCFVGGQLAAAGRARKVTARPRIAEELAQHGLTLSDQDDCTLRVAAKDLAVALDPEVLASADVVLVTVKSGATREMAASIRAFAPTHATVVSLQNGVDNATLLHEALPGMKVVAGGGTDASIGYFVKPTLITTEDPMVRHMQEELFGPILTLHVSPDHAWDETLKLVDATSPYALTGAVFARDRAAIVNAQHELRHAAGNFYINDKPTGAVVGQQPFGGARASGTNDKAGSAANLMRWTSPRSIKETFVAPTSIRYPHQFQD